MLNLCPQSEGSGPEMRAWAALASAVKGVGPGGLELLKNAPNAHTLIWRWVFASQNLADPNGAVATILAGLGGWRDPRLRVETYVGIAKADIGRLITFLQVAVPLLNAAGLKVIGPSSYTGDYDQSTFDALRAAGWCGLSEVSVQAYWAGAGFTLWNALRWRTYYDPAKDPATVLLTECGRDVVRDGPNGTYIGRGGWIADGLSAHQYADELVAYATQLRPNEIAFPFVGDPTPDWNGYSLNPVASLIIPRLSEGGSPVPTPPSPTSWALGVDLSHYQPTVDFSLLARTRQFAILNATEGTTIVDRTFSARWDALAAVGMARGAYLFARPSAGNGASDAAHFLSVVSKRVAGDVAVIDLEDDQVSPTADLRAYLIDLAGHIKAAWGAPPLIYSTASYLRSHNCAYGPDLLDCGLWIANYQTTVPTDLAGWSYWACWQHYDKASVPGVAGLVDVDVFNGSVETFRKYGKPA